MTEKASKELTLTRRILSDYVTLVLKDLELGPLSVDITSTYVDYVALAIVGFMAPERMQQRLKARFGHMAELYNWQPPAVRVNQNQDKTVTGYVIIQRQHVLTSQQTRLPTGFD